MGDQSSPFPPPDTLDWPLLDRYLAGQESAAELRVVEGWLSSRPALRTEVEALRRALTSPYSATARQALPSDIDRRIAAVLQVPSANRRLGQPSSGHAPSRVAQASALPWFSRAGISSSSWKAISTMAAIAVVVVGGWFATRPSRLPVETAYREYRTAASERAVVQLEDGSQAILAAQTTLRIPKHFGRAGRTAILNGQAYFTVTANGNQPFIVQTAEFQTRVLGTTFAVQHYANDTSVQVAVETGKVVVSAVKHPSRSVIVPAGHVAHVSNNVAIATFARDLSPYVDWTQGRFIFNDVTVANALKALGTWYGYRFHLADSALAQQHVSAVFEHRTIGEVTAALRVLLGVTTTIQGDTIVLHRKTRAAPLVRPQQFHLQREVGR